MVLDMKAEEARMLKENDNKRKRTETEMANPSDTKKQKRSSLLLVKAADPVTDDKPGVVEAPNQKDTPETAVKKEDLQEKASPRGKQWIAVAKFCLKLHKVSWIYQDDHPEFKKFMRLAGSTAKRVKYCNELLPGPISKKDNWNTLWGPVDKNRWFMMMFLRQLQSLQASFVKKCLTLNDKEDLDTIRRAKINMKKALSKDPVLEYVENIPREVNKSGVVNWTESEKHRIMFFYRVKRYFKPNIGWDKVTTFFNCRTNFAVKTRFKAMRIEAKAPPAKKPTQGSKKRVKKEQ